MAELSTLARPYAKAAFEYAASAGELQGWSQSLALAAAVAQQRQCCAAIELAEHYGRSAGRAVDRYLWRRARANRARTFWPFFLRIADSSYCLRFRTSLIF